MREKFKTQLTELNDSMIKLGSLCETAISLSVKALLGSDPLLAEKVYVTEQEIDRMEQDIESLCMRLILQQQPVAGDLRAIHSALKMITDMERIGDQAADIAGLIQYCHLDAAGSECREDIRKMAEAAINMVTESVEAFVRSDISIAYQVIGSDNIVDDLFIKIKCDIIKVIADNTAQGETAFDIVMIAKYLERIGDHAVNVAEWVIFSVTGEHAKGK